MMLLCRLALGFLFLTGVVIGLWASFAPGSWYASFPGFGHHWVSIDGPYNLHLIRDVGAAYMVIAAIAGLALLRPDQVTPMAAGIASLFFNAPHLAYHATHLAMYPRGDAVLSLVALSLAALSSLWLAVSPGLVRA